MEWKSRFIFWVDTLFIRFVKDHIAVEVKELHGITTL